MQLKQEDLSIKGWSIRWGPRKGGSGSGVGRPGGQAGWGWAVVGVHVLVGRVGEGVGVGLHVGGQHGRGVGRHVHVGGGHEQPPPPCGPSISRRCWRRDGMEFQLVMIGIYNSIINNTRKFI